MSAFNNYSIFPINIDEVLRLLEYYLREVAKYQWTSEHNTNNILANLINQF